MASVYIALQFKIGFVSMPITKPITNRCSKLPLTALVSSASSTIHVCGIENTQLRTVYNQIEFTIAV